MNTLDPISPQEALDWYLEHREDDLRTATLRKYESALSIFVDWTDEAGTDDMNDVKGRQLMQFKTWRKQEAGLATVSLNGNLAILQRFLRFCENIDAVPEGLAERVPMPNVPEAEEVNYEVPSDEEVEGIKSYSRQFDRASRRHLEFELIAEVGMRLGAVRGMDLEDFDPEEKTIYIRDRPEGPDEYGTPLKNDAKGERIVNISPELRNLIVDYIDHRRNDVTDRYGREPLMATSKRRPTTAAIRRDFYKMSRPCVSENDCPRPDDRRLRCGEQRRGCRLPLTIQHASTPEMGHHEPIQ